MGHKVATLDELGEGYGFRKVRKPLGVTAFGVNALVLPPGWEGFFHYHDEQDELYFVHSGTGRFEAEDETYEVTAGGFVHVESTTPRRWSNPSDSEELVLVVIGAKGGYVGRDGQLVDMADLPKRQSLSSGG